MGWVSLLQNDYIRTADVIVRGVSGYNTKWFLNNVLPTIEEELTSNKYAIPSLITLWLGTNDAVLTNGSNPEMHVPVTNYKENLVKIVNGFQKLAPDAAILLITPAHVDDGARINSERNDTKRGLVDRSNAVTSNYSQACVEVAGTLDVPVLDLNAHFNAMAQPERNAFLLDGLHYNAEGNKVVHELLQSKINSDFLP